MKKKLALVLSVLLLLGTLTACGKKEEPKPEPQPSPGAETAAKPEPQPVSSAGPYTFDGSVVFEKDGVKVTTAGLDTDPTSAREEPIVWLDVENTGAKDAYLGVTDGSVNGVTSELRIVEYYVEDEVYYGGNYEVQLTVPAGSSNRYALWYNSAGIPGIDLSTPGELEFCFTTAENEDDWPNYTSEPVVITAGAAVPAIDITKLGTVAIDDDKLTLVLGGQDYEDWFGPEVWVYVANKTDKYIGVYPETAEADGVFCDYLLGGLRTAPGKVSAGTMSFDGEAKELRGFENLSMTFSLLEAADPDGVTSGNGTTLGPVSAQYPPQVWGDYENDGMCLSIQPKYNDLITVTTPENDENGVLISVFETASMETNEFEGAGWLFDIARIDAARFHEMLCHDMTGVDVFAKDGSGDYYVWYHPTDVRFARATTEEMQRDAEQWSMLCEWAENAKDKFIDQNGLEYVGVGNAEVNMYAARAAWESGANYTLSTTEFGPVAGKGVDGTPYAEFLSQIYFDETEDEAPDGEYVVLNFPDEDVRVDFFFAPDNYVRIVSGDRETIYQAVWGVDNISCAEAMQGWYYALAERAGVRQADKSLDPYCGFWGEKIAGRGQIEITKSLAPGKVSITVTWPESAAVLDTWEFLAALDEDGKLVYADGHKTVEEYGDDGDSWITDESYDESGCFYLNDAKELCWHDDKAEGGEDSVFVRAD
jgi:predicted small lipoprotein YifL